MKAMFATNIDWFGKKNLFSLQKTNKTHFSPTPAGRFADNGQ
jgi:hypothetical protein